MPPYPSALILHSATTDIDLATAIASQPFRTAAASDFATIPLTVPGADALFSQYSGALFRLLPEHWQVQAWEEILETLNSADPSRYGHLHKGSAFYFVAVASFLARDFMKALHYFDAALGEDLRAPGSRWQTTPAGYFVLLDHQPTSQLARPLVTTLQALFSSWTTQNAAAGGTQLTLPDYRARFVLPAVASPGKRSLVTALLSYLLEFSDRQAELRLVPLSSTTGESVYLHLFKGALLLESLIRASPAGAAIVATNPKATLDDFLRSPSIHSPLGFGSQPQGLGGATLNDVFTAIATDATTTSPLNHRAVRAAWGLRNKTGHNLAWPNRPTAQEHETAARLLFCAHSAIIHHLW